MVGELKHFYPEKNVTLVHNGPSLVSNPDSMANPKFRKRMLDIVQKSGANVILDDSVDRALFKGDEWIVEGPLTLNTSKGVSLTGVDLLFKAVGVPKPSGRLLSSSCFEKDKQLDKDGYFIVNKHFQVVDKAGLFALGDCLTYDSEAKTIMAIMFRLGLVVKNVVAACKDQPLQGVVPRQTLSAMFVPFGPKDGAGYVGSWTLPKFVVVSSKSKNLFIPETWKEMGFSKPQ
jgi:NADH dehydrogenase FAD-containing subunit